jgi:glycosyltransferase involved in cell wall biosynthesis
MKILIISSNFPPLNGIACLRPYSWAKYWAKKGHNVTVLTTKKPQSDIKLNLDLSYFRLIEVPIPWVDYLRKFDDNKPITPSNFTHAKPARGFFNKFFSSIHALRRSRGIFLAARMPDHHDLWIIPAYRSVCRETWDLVVSTHQPYANHIIGYYLSKRNKTRKWIADFRDLWVDDHLYRGIFPFTVIESFLEKQICITAHYLTTVSNPLANTLRSKYGPKVHVIENGFDPEIYPLLPKTPAFPSDGLKRIVYTGTIYQGKRDPEPLFQAISELRDESFEDVERLRVTFAGRRLKNIREISAQYGISDLIEHEGFVTWERSLTMQRDADILLFLEVEAPGVSGILTGKLFEYLASGTQIMGIGVSASSSVGELVHQSGSGIMLGQDIAAIKKALQQLLTEGSYKKKIHPMIRERFDRSRLADRMISLIDNSSR